MKINNSVSLITGANRGIGRAIVEELLHRGAGKVYATGRNLTDLDPIVKLDPGRVKALQLDITNAEEITAVAEAAPDVNLLFNNAGALDFGSLLEAPVDSIRRLMDINYFGTLNVSRALAPSLAKNGGAVVNLLTVVALASMPGIGGYNASKAATWSLTQSLRADLSKRNVDVFGVFPGPIDTDMSRGIDIPKTPPADVAREILDGIEAGTLDIFPDPMSKQVYESWRTDHKAVEAQFAAM